MTSKALFYKHLAQTSAFPMALEIERAEGMYMYDPQGKPYLDLISGIGVSALGHRHPDVVKAIHDQLDKYMHLMVYGEFIQSPQVHLAKLLTDNLPDPLDNVYFVNSGSEAVEGALKLAKRHTGRTQIIAFRNAYHGSTHGALSVTGNESLKNAFRPLLPDVLHLDYNKPGQLEKITSRAACVIAETIQGEAGAIVPDAAFMTALRNRCYDTGALLILDEIQCGMGRTGKLWAFEHYNIIPDILTLAKGLGGGMPIGAFIASKQLMQCLTHDPVLGHITTFGGNAVCATTAHATLQLIVKAELWKEAAKKEQIFRRLLTHPTIKKIRGKGLMLAVEFDSFEQNKKIIDKCLKRGLITDWFLFAGNCLRIAPPLIISEDQITEACHTIIESID
jgi:acetylornithine/N-succinyldiaminopimelate aminotransferase